MPVGEFSSLSFGCEKAGKVEPVMGSDIVPRKPMSIKMQDAEVEKRWRMALIRCSLKPFCRLGKILIGAEADIVHMAEVIL